MEKIEILFYILTNASSIIMEEISNIFENSIISVYLYTTLQTRSNKLPNETFNIVASSCQDDYRLIEVKSNFDESIVYFVYCKKSEKHYWAFYNPIIQQLCIWCKICVDDNKLHYKRLKNMIRVNLCNITLYNIYAPLSETRSNIYLTSIPYNYKIYKCDEAWRIYNDELNEELDENENKNININYPITKISHMREIVDLIASFL